LVVFPSKSRSVTHEQQRIVYFFQCIIALKLLGEVLEELQGATVIYTDGSKTEDLVGIGIFLDDNDSYRFRLPRNCGIFTAEMCAIHSACNLTESKLIGAEIALLLSNE
jgi:hypothetical protein